MRDWGINCVVLVRLGAYGEPAFRLLSGLASHSESAELRLAQIAPCLADDSEVAVSDRHWCTAPWLERLDANDARAMRRARLQICGFALEAVMHRACAAFGGEPSRLMSGSVAKLRADPCAGRPMGLEGCEGATLAECLCLVELMRQRPRAALAKAYGEGMVRRIAGAPADPLTASAIGVLTGRIRAAMEEENAAISAAAIQAGGMLQGRDAIRAIRAKYAALVDGLESQIGALRALDSGPGAFPISPDSKETT